MTNNRYRMNAGRGGPQNNASNYGRGGADQPNDSSRRAFLTGGLAALGAAGTLGVGSAAVLTDDLLAKIGGSVAGVRSTTSHHVLVLDGTDRNSTTVYQTRAIVQELLHGRKHQYEAGDPIDITRLGQNIGSPLEFESSFVSPGNEQTASGLTTTLSELERAWNEEVVAIEAAIFNAIRPMPQPETTLLFEAVDRAVEHARRQSGPSAPVYLSLGTDLLVHESGPGISAYASERVPQFPAPSSPLMAQLPASSLEGVSIQIVGIRRDGRKTRSGRDLGDIQRKVAPVLIEYWASRGADVSTASLTWV